MTSAGVDDDASAATRSAASSTATAGSDRRGISSAATTTGTPAAGSGALQDGQLLARSHEHRHGLAPGDAASHMRQAELAGHVGGLRAAVVVDADADRVAIGALIDAQRRSVCARLRHGQAWQQPETPARRWRPRECAWTEPAGVAQDGDGRRIPGRGAEGVGKAQQPADIGPTEAVDRLVGVAHPRRRWSGVRQEGPGSATCSRSVSWYSST